MAKQHHPKPPDVVPEDLAALGGRLATLTRRVTHLEKERAEMNQALQGLLDRLKTLEELATHTADQLHHGGGGGGGVSQADVEELEGYADRATQTLNEALQGGGNQGGGEQGGGEQGGGQTQPQQPQRQQPQQPPQQPPQPKLTPAQAAAQILGRGKGRVSQ